jgi:hypothetical protein
VKSFLFLPLDIHTVELAHWRLRGKNQELWCLARRSIQHAREGIGANYRIENRCRVLRHALRIVREDPCHIVFPENRARLLEVVGKEKTRAIIDPIKAFMRASRYPGLP